MPDLLNLNFHMASIQRRKSVTCTIGGVRVGSDAPVVVQSMTNTDTADVASTVEQVASLARAGSELVRVTVNNEDAAAAVPQPVAGASPGVVRRHRGASARRAGGVQPDRRGGADPRDRLPVDREDRDVIPACVHGPSGVRARWLCLCGARVCVPGAIDDFFR